MLQPSPTYIRIYIYIYIYTGKFTSTIMPWPVMHRLHVGNPPPQSLAGFLHPCSQDKSGEYWIKPSDNDNVIKVPLHACVNFHSS